MQTFRLYGKKPVLGGARGAASISSGSMWTWSHNVMSSVWVTHQ